MLSDGKPAHTQPLLGSQEGRMLTAGCAVAPPALELTVEGTPAEVTVDGDAAVMCRVAIGERKDAGVGGELWKTGQARMESHLIFLGHGPCALHIPTPHTSCLSLAVLTQTILEPAAWCRLHLLS